VSNISGMVEGIGNEEIISMIATEAFPYDSTKGYHTLGLSVRTAMKQAEAALREAPFVKPGAEIEFTVSVEAKVVLSGDRRG